MDQDFDQDEELTTCVDCGTALLGGPDQSYACGPGAYLCFACAERRGGVFDAHEDRWTRPPDVSGIPDERRPHP